MISFFLDPVLRAPTIGCMLMGLSSALIGVIVLLRKKSLIGEALSHAAYPGVMLTLFLLSCLTTYSEDLFFIFLLIGGSLSSLLGLKVISFLEHELRIKSDAALCFVLSIFFGVGILFASRLQITAPLLYRQAQLFLYGQAATMTDIHIFIYALILTLVISFLLFYFRDLETLNFDRHFALSIGIPAKKLDNFTFLLLVLTIIVGIRSAGVVLMSGLLIAPAAAAKPLCKKFSHHLFFSGMIGCASGFLGNYLSLKIPQGAYSLPTGPTILLCATCFCLLSLILAPHKGILSRLIRAFIFRLHCQVENDLKAIWKAGHKEKLESFWSHFFLKKNKWIIHTDAGYVLSVAGEFHAEKIVRLHRLWEVYLVDYMGQGIEKVHRSAEELEHLFTPALEKELTRLLKDPKKDPHAQPIPSWQREENHD